MKNRSLVNTGHFSYCLNRAALLGHWRHIRHVACCMPWVYKHWIHAEVFAIVRINPLATSDTGQRIKGRVDNGDTVVARHNNADGNIHYRRRAAFTAATISTSGLPSERRSKSFTCRHFYSSQIYVIRLPASVKKQATVVLISKSKPPKSVEQDQRPISLTSTISEIFESFVGRWIPDAIGGSIRQKTIRNY